VVLRCRRVREPMRARGRVLALAGTVTLATVGAARADGPACLTRDEVRLVAPGAVKHMADGTCATAQQIATWREDDRHARAMARLAGGTVAHR